MTKFLFFVNILFSGLLLILSIFYYFGVESFSVFSVFSLFVPLLFLLNILFVVFWLFKKSGKLLISLASLFIGYLFFGSFYSMINVGEDSITKDDLNIMTYNVRGFNKYDWIKDSNVGDSIIDFIKKEDPAILCVQEHDRIRYRQFRHFEYGFETPFSISKSTQAIFSKYPIISEGSLDLPATVNNIIFADILIQKDTIRVYNIHLQSFNIVPSRKSFSEQESEKNYRRLVSTFEKQLEQAKIFDEHRSTCPYPYVVCGDMNNTQFSNVYKRLRGDLQDTFFEQGSGFGKTYSLFGLPLRIDYVLPDATFEVIGHKNYKIKLSDHFPVMATLRRESNP